MTSPAVVAAIGVGSNLDDPAAQVELAIRRLGQLPGVRILARSSLYRSAPLGPQDQPDFANAVVLVETGLSARMLLDGLQAIETDLGRRRDSARWGPRVIDLDLLLYGDLELDEPGLTVPHPRMHERNFVLLPLREIAPEVDIPGRGPLGAIAVDENHPRIEKID